MNKLLTLAVALAAVSAIAAAPKCSDGRPPRLNGDAFSPVECSTVTKSVPALAGTPAADSKDVPADLKSLEGRWEGAFAHALGRYQAALTVKTAWSGKAEMTLELTELQFHEKLTDSLTLKPGKGRGVYEAVLSSSKAADISLKGALKLGAEAAAVFVGTSTGTVKALPVRQADLVFENGASHRIVFSQRGKDALDAAWSMAVPGAPTQNLRLTLRRAAKS